jgi:hypothetical protein
MAVGTGLALLIGRIPGGSGERCRWPEPPQESANALMFAHSGSEISRKSLFRLTIFNLWTGLGPELPAQPFDAEAPGWTPSPRRSLTRSDRVTG